MIVEDRVHILSLLIDYLSRHRECARYEEQEGEE
jgi:hypothetical protein